MSVDGTPSLSTTGGAGGFDAQLEAVRGLAAEYDAAAGRLVALGGGAAATLVDPALVGSAPWSPATFAVAEAHVAGLNLGPTGLPAGAAGWWAQAAAVRAAATLLEEADALVADLHHDLRYLASYQAGWSLGTLGRAVGVDADGLRPDAPAADLHGLAARLSGPGDGPGGEDAAVLEAWAMANPEAAEALVARAPGLLEGLWDSGDLVPTPFGGRWYLPSVGVAAGVLGLWYVDGRARVERVAATTSRGPGDLAAGVAALDRVNALSTAERPEGNGTIEIQRVGSGEQARWVVLLPGTDDPGTLPGEQDDDVRDLGTNLRAMAGQSTAYQRGVEAAMTEAGIGPDDPVTIWGHSQGGMAAVQVASGGRFAVEDVITLGSPIGAMPPAPDGVRVTSLENERDVLVLLDGTPNPDRVEHLTVRFAGGGTTPGEAHSLAEYARGAAAVDAATDPVVRHRVEELRASGALGDGEPAVSWTYRITREGVG
ncbi:hypothetical protein QE364_002296 [Nocardioides zeae]|uniref:Uncharacterized protein n=2 Tax=Nocardioides zeae TaxID=1457234 RepID=A0ACC6IIQ9_9ACTN|nr:hypothetical protein [Nocardioides zeae]MDQ1105845.1 hypothetical protein [Nocardioides zeae]MDR6174509.1 hypothetical protein [Nocardioides zeae]MDR6210581.1 hypothetical protein [Nocardioides zeae]